MHPPLVLGLSRTPEVADPGANEREVLERVDERVPLEERALLPQQPVELRAVVVRAEAAEQDEVLRALDRLDDVDLEEAEPPNGVQHVRGAAVEELCAHGDPPRFLEADLHRRTSSQPDRACEPVEGSVESVVERTGRADAVLAVEGADDEAPFLPLRLQIGAADDPVAAQEREHVIAVLPLRRRLVDLDQVVEAEDPPREGAIPEQVVERREEYGGARGGPVELGIS